jgi:protein TonB
VPPARPSLSRGGAEERVVAEYSAPRLTPPLEREAFPTSGVDGDVIPLVRVTPEYPPNAALRGTEGFVRVRFSVTTAGTVRDAVVVASEPGTIFDDAALQAIARWRYNPRVVDGVAVERVGLETLLRFELE